MPAASLAVKEKSKTDNKHKNSKEIYVDASERKFNMLVSKAVKCLIENKSIELLARNCPPSWLERFNSEVQIYRDYLLTL